MKKVLFFIFFLFTILDAKENLTLALSANVSFVKDELIRAFEAKNPNIEVKSVIGSSGKLAAQIINGAPFDLFMSADMNYPALLYKNNLSKNPPKVYAKGVLILFSFLPRDFSKGLDLLKDENIKKIAIANPKIAPYGKASVEVMKNYKIYSQVKNKLIFAQSISQTFSYVKTAADIAFISKSIVFDPKLKGLKEKINWIELDHSLYTPIKQGVVVLNDKNSSKRFYNFLFSKKAKEIFKKYGYIVE